MQKVKYNIILFCEALKNRAGIERMTVELANLMADIYDVSIVVLNAFSYESCPYQIKENVRVISLDAVFSSKLLGSNRSSINKLREIVKDVKPIAVITVATPLIRISAPALGRLKVKNIGWEHFNIFAGSKKGTVFKLLASWRTSATVALTEADGKAYKKFFSPNVTVIPNFTSIGVNEPSKCENKVLLAVGRHAPQKGFDMLVKAWAKTDAPGWKLRIVGSGKDKQKNEQLARDLGVWDRIEFIEAHPNIAQEFQNASCFVLSSRFEGMVLVLLEAKMMGLPCVSFNCPESPKEVIQDNIDGWLVPAENIDALANELTFRLRDMEGLRKAGKEARRDAINRYSPQAIKSIWQNLIEKEV